MAGILQTIQDFTQVPNPPEGFCYYGVDTDGTLKVKNSAGTIALVMGATGPAGPTGSVGPTGSSVGNYYTITEADSGSTLSETYSTFFVTIPYEYFDVYLPSVSDMIGRSLLFIKTDGNPESTLIINGPFVDSESTYSLNSSDYGSVTFISDGSTWYVTETIS